MSVTWSWCLVNWNDLWPFNNHIGLLAALETCHIGESVDTHFTSACHFHLGTEVLIQPLGNLGKRNTSDKVNRQFDVTTDVYRCSQKRRCVDELIRKWFSLWLPKGISMCSAYRNINSQEPCFLISKSTLLALKFCHWRNLSEEISKLNDTMQHLSWDWAAGTDKQFILHSAPAGWWAAAQFLKPLLLKSQHLPTIII